jgi:hypothetical protein
MSIIPAAQEAEEGRTLARAKLDIIHKTFIFADKYCLYFISKGAFINSAKVV